MNSPRHWRGAYARTRAEILGWYRPHLDASLQLIRALVPEDHLVVGAFDISAPERCSGLPAQRCAVQDLVRAFSPRFRPLAYVSEPHATPGGTAQPCNFCLFQRVR